MNIEVQRFVDGRLKVVVRFEQSSNYWGEPATWVPTLREVELLDEVVSLVDEGNKIKRSVHSRVNR